MITTRSAGHWECGRNVVLRRLPGPSEELKKARSSSGPPSKNALLYKPISTMWDLSSRLTLSAKSNVHVTTVPCVARFDPTL